MAGMDRFEFLDRRPKMDEPLASHIFRQVRDLMKIVWDHFLLVLLASLCVLYVKLFETIVVTEKRYSTKNIVSFFNEW